MASAVHWNIIDCPAGKDAFNKMLGHFTKSTAKCDFCSHSPSGHSKGKANDKIVEFKCVAVPDCGCHVRVNKPPKESSPKASASSGPRVSSSDAESAEAAGPAFLKLIDAGNHEEAYASRHSLWTTKVEFDATVEEIKAFRPDDQEVASRTQCMAQAMDSIPGLDSLPKQTYILLQFQTKLVGGGGFIEQTIITQDDGEWKVFFYSKARDLYPFEL